MKKGYRLNSAHAYANYYADITNTADFGRFDGVVGAAKRFGGSIRDVAGRGVRAVDGVVSGTGARLANRANRVMLGSNSPAQLRRRQRMLGAAAIGTGALAAGGAGYGGYRALRQEDEME